MVQAAKTGFERVSRIEPVQDLVHGAAIYRVDCVSVVCTHSPLRNVHKNGRVFTRSLRLTGWLTTCNTCPLTSANI